MQLLTYIEVNQKVRDALQASISAYERNGGKVATYPLGWSTDCLERPIEMLNRQQRQLHRARVAGLEADDDE